MINTRQALNLFFIGSRTIRTEEAILITLAALADKIHPSNIAREFTYKEAIPQSEDTGMKTDFPPKKDKKRRRENVQEDFEPSEKKIADDGQVVELFHANVVALKDQNLDRFD